MSAVLDQTQSTSSSPRKRWAPSATVPAFSPSPGARHRLLPVFVARTASATPSPGLQLPGSERTSSRAARSGRTETLPAFLFWQTKTARSPGVATQRTSSNPVSESIAAIAPTDGTNQLKTASLASGEFSTYPIG